MDSLFCMAACGHCVLWQCGGLLLLFLSFPLFKKSRDTRQVVDNRIIYIRTGQGSVCLSVCLCFNGDKVYSSYGIHKGCLSTVFKETLDWLYNIQVAIIP